jgi:phage portal protein BeeE
MTTDKGTDKPPCGATRIKGSGCGNAGESANKQTKTPSMNDRTIRELVEMVLKDELGDMIAEIEKKMEARAKEAILVEFKKQNTEMINIELQKRLLQGN